MVGVLIRRTWASLRTTQRAMATAQPIAPQTRTAPRIAPRKQAKLPVFLWANGLALLAIGVFFRCWHLGNIPGVHGAEAWYGVQALRVASGQPIVWLTPTGNPLNLFYFLPLVALHYVLPPSVTLLRIVPLVSGVAAVAVNYLLCRRAFDVRTARVSTLILALLPLNIAYSRFGWDASQSLLATLLVIYLPLMRLCASHGRAALSAGAAFAAAAAILVHPTNLFALVLLFVPAVYVRREALDRMLRRTRLPAKSWALAALVAMVGLCAFAAWRWRLLSCSSCTDHATSVRSWPGICGCFPERRFINSSPAPGSLRPRPAGTSTRPGPAIGASDCWRYSLCWASCGGSARRPRPPTFVWHTAGC